MNQGTEILKTGRSKRSGMTLIELTVVILVLLSLVALLFIGAKAWKDGSDRAGCIMLLRQGQVGMRSYASMNGYNPGDPHTGTSLKTEVIGTDKFIEQEPSCPGKGTYTFATTMVPNLGNLFMACSLNASLDHEPEAYSDW